MAYNFRRICDEVPYVYEYSSGAFIVQYPTDNCQWGCIGRFHNILSIEDFEQRDKLLKIFLKTLSQKMVLVDINDYEIYRERIKQHFSKEDIVFCKPYKSTNDSDMVMYLLKTQKYYQASSVL